MAKKRKFTTFSLSFLDIMSCGFGAVVLVFLIIKHDVNTQVEAKNVELQAEVNLLEEEVTSGEEHLVRIKNTISLLDQQLVETSGLARRINDDIDALTNMIRELEQAGDDQQIDALKQQIANLKQEKEKLEQLQAEGNDVRRFVGQGNRQYLTGLQLGGERILILLDASASMLDETLVNIIRRRNMSDSTKRLSEKWQRAIRTVEWLIAKFPQQSQFQIYSFNTLAKASIANTDGQWLAINDQPALNQSLLNLRDLIPAGGTSLENAFRVVHRLQPMPDNIILITDGLPTQGAKPSKASTISGPEREQLFEQAVTILPQGVPVNVLLWPMEGDPMAAAAFWKLAQVTAGSFISPSKDWP